MVAKAYLKDYLTKNGYNLSKVQIDQFEKYASMLIEWNQKMNLSAIDDLDGIYEKHFMDSLSIAIEHPLNGSFCDVGSGAGFPSIPLKILLPDLQVTIVEALGKRVTFLKALCEALHIDVNIVNARCEDYALINRECFDYVSARAVANLSMLAELCIPLVKKNGYFIAMKGSKAYEEQKQASKATSILGCEFEKAIEHVMSDGAKHINLYYRKVKASDSRYPRLFAKIKKNPL